MSPGRMTASPKDWSFDSGNRSLIPSPKTYCGIRSPLTTAPCSIGGATGRTQRAV